MFRRASRQTGIVPCNYEAYTNVRHVSARGSNTCRSIENRRFRRSPVAVQRSHDTNNAERIAVIQCSYTMEAVSFIDADTKSVSDDEWDAATCDARKAMNDIIMGTVTACKLYTFTSCELERRNLRCILAESSLYWSCYLSSMTVNKENWRPWLL